MQKTITTTFAEDELREIISESVKIGLQSLSPQHKEEEDYLTREEVCKKLRVSLVTLREWDKRNILKPARIGSRVRYLRSHIEEALTSVKKYGRRPSSI